VPTFKRDADKFGKLRLPFELHDFHGWTAGALWEGLKFDAKHFAHIERLAIVGDQKWEKGMATFCKPFTAASIRCFSHDQAAAARAWLAEEAQPDEESNQATANTDDTATTPKVESQKHTPNTSPQGVTMSRS